MSPSRAPSRVGVAVPAAGAGHRLGGLRKAFLELAGRPVLQHSLEPFLALEEVVAVAVALPADEVGDPPRWLQGLDPRIRLVAGGSTRLRSVLAALEALDAGEAPEVVLIHDAARPLVTDEIIRRCIDGARAGEGAVAGWPAVDTLKEVDQSGLVVATPDRRRLWRAQTPQAFPYRQLLGAYRRAAQADVQATDDAELFARAGGAVRMVEGSPWNLKVTHPGDVPVAEFLLGDRAPGPGRPEAAGGSAGGAGKDERAAG